MIYTCTEPFFNTIDSIMHPTNELYTSLIEAYEHFNVALFKGELPTVIFTVQRQKGVMGYFAPDRWDGFNDKNCSEISINPAYIGNSRLIEVMQTLVHEMVHCWQHCLGNPGRDYYHNKEWALKMIEVGLMPSSTGEPGGRITGQKMADYIIEEGAFYRAFQELYVNKGFQLGWIDRRALPRLFDPVISAIGSIDGASNETASSEVAETMPTLSELLKPTESSKSNFLIPEVPKRQTRTRYICTGCNSKIYGKAQLNILCVDCDQLFESNK